MATTSCAITVTGGIGPGLEVVEQTILDVDEFTINVKNQTLKINKNGNIQEFDISKVMGSSLDILILNHDINTLEYQLRLI